MALTPTAEQQQAIDLFKSGQNLAIEAGAGTGKTATLIMLAEAAAAQSRIGQYLAFNRAIVNEAGAKLPGNTTASTAHSLAFRAVGKKFAPRLRSPRMKSMELARRLRMDPLVIRYGEQSKPMAAGYLAGLTMRAVSNFCQSADPEPAEHHVPYVDGIDVPHPDGGRGWTNNRQVRAHVMPAVRRAWADVCDPQGQLPFKHDCQPPGTLVRRVVRYGGGVSGEGVYEDVPIEGIRAGDRVVSFTMNQRRGYVRRAGRLVTAAGSRWFDGDLLRLRTERGRSSAVTPNHWCVVRLDADLSEGNHVVYLARRGDQFRVGRTTWRTRTQGNTLGIVRRAISQKAEAVWVLSVHHTDEKAALAEAITSYDYGIPSWTWSGPRTVMPREPFWQHVGSNVAAGVRCLTAYGRDVMHPLWTPSDGAHNFRRPMKVRACNLLSGMLVCEPDEMTPQAYGMLNAYEGSKAWAAVSVSREAYRGEVYNLDVETDHTYVADGIVTGNCYLKVFERSAPRIAADFILFDEAQDASPVLLSIVQQQTHAQLVFVGDGAQAIYGFTGAVNALDRIRETGAASTMLQQSFRFGQAVADVANGLLERLDVELRLVGNPDRLSVVASTVEPDAILTRTNAVAVETLLAQYDEGRRAALVGGGAEVAAFARAAQDLMAGKWTSHPDLACFADWPEVIDYTQHDEQGGELRLMVKLVTDYGPATIIDAIARAADERSCDVTVSTAHKSKGREWPTVKLAGDFSVPRNGESDCSADELRLLYVACTRAQRELDVTLVPQALAVPEAGEKMAPAVDAGSVGEHLAAAHAVTSPATLAMHEVLHAEGASHEHAASTSAGFSGAVVTRGPIEVGQ